MSYGFNGTGTIQDGNIQGKVIMNQSLMDESSWPWCADWYRHKVIESKGSEDDYRLYLNENCLHGDVSSLQSSRVVNYLGSLAQSLFSLKGSIETVYDKPGPYFAAVRVSSNVNGNPDDIFTQVLNLDRARIVVE